jgi:hypothetical protein
MLADGTKADGWFCDVKDLHQNCFPLSAMIYLGGLPA